ncbi:DUF6371 domain-containing protein [Chitinophaga jiangningensis]|nr:DUF6371 domain-containing protein [Chitinophaga jiangningensis]
MSGFRYILERGSKKHTCPACGRKTFVVYIDTMTNQAVTGDYGRCDREVNCGYFRKPGHVPAFIPSAIKVNPAPAVNIPVEILKQYRTSYSGNSFVQYLAKLFGADIASELVTRYQIGTSNNRWPGAAIFWFINQAGEIRAGQVKLFDHDGHTAKYQDKEGNVKSATTWIHSILQRGFMLKKQPLPTWLESYTQQSGSYISCLFGEQLLKQDKTKPVAIVEAPATAIVASVYMPEFIWLAAGSLSYLNSERTKALHGRKVVLFPDLSTDGKAFIRWQQVAKELSNFMFIQVSDILELHATEDDRQKGCDLRDFLTHLKPAIGKDSEGNLLKVTLQNLTFEIKSLVAVSCPGKYTDGLQLVTFEMVGGGHCEAIVDGSGEFYSGEFSESLKRMWGNDFKIGQAGNADCWLSIKC